MSHQMQGMDTEQARETAGQMGQHAGLVAGECSRLLARVSATSWIGPDKDRITDDIGQRFLPQAQAASESLDQQACRLVDYADRQDAASA